MSSVIKFCTLFSINNSLNQEETMKDTDLSKDALIEFIKTRRSCRSFSAGDIPEEDVRTILDCALAAPSARGMQTWKFTAVMNREKIAALCAAVGKALGREGYDMYKPSVLIITSNEKSSPFREVDNACAMENIYLAAKALGLGCVWINQLLDCFDNPEVRAVLSGFGIPENHGVYGCAALGYPGEVPGPKTVKGESRIVK